MGTDIKEEGTPDVVADSADEQATPATPPNATEVKRAGMTFRVLLRGISEIDLWIKAGHTPACFGLTGDSAALTDLFVSGSNIIPDNLKDAARLIKGCAGCTEVLKATTEDMGGTLPKAWEELEPAKTESLPEGAEGSDESGE